MSVQGLKGLTGHRFALISEALFNELKANSEKAKQVESGQFQKVLDIDTELKNVLAD